MALLGDRRTPASVHLVRAREAERVSETGAVGSVQEAEVTLPGSGLERIWSPPYLERLGRAYWRHLNRATLGLIRVVYAEDSRTVVLLSRRLGLLRFHAPEYQAAADHGCVTWRIERGLLVAADGRDNGFLRIRVERRPGRERPGAQQWVRVRLEVRNFYPWLRGSGRFARFGAWLYGQTQLRIHVFVGNSFLRSLAQLDLPPSRVGA
ncbi:MAG: hypothetical protein ACRDLO_05290, partial [Solirubrobacterales bacterium]